MISIITAEATKLAAGSTNQINDEGDTVEKVLLLLLALLLLLLRRKTVMLTTSTTATKLLAMLFRVNSLATTVLEGVIRVAQSMAAAVALLLETEAHLLWQQPCCKVARLPDQVLSLGKH